MNRLKSFPWTLLIEWEKKERKGRKVKERKGGKEKDRKGKGREGRNPMKRKTIRVT